MYQKATYRVLGGGLNLRSAATETADHEHQKILNANFDADGTLRSRRGHTTICSASNVKQMIHALGSRWQAINAAYIVGFKNYVWKMGTGTANKDCSAVIATTGARKTKGTQDWSWGIAAPTTKCKASAITPPETTVVDTSGGFTVDPSGDENYNNGHLTINPQTDGSTYTADKNISVDLGLDAGFSIDDVIRVRFFAHNWRRIEAITIMLDCGDGTFTKDYYTCRIDSARKLRGIRSTEVFYIRKRPLAVDRAAQDKKRYSAFERIGSTADKDWRSLSAVRVKVSFIQTTKWRFEECVCIGNDQNQIEGDDLQYYYTYVNADLHESNPSPPSDAIVVNRGSVALSGFTASSDPQVTGMNVYTNRGGSIYRINDDPLPIGDATDQQSDDDLTNRGEQMEDDNDLPPTADGCADSPYFGRILAFKGTRLYWSKQNKPYAFVSPDGPDGNWVDLSEDGGNIKFITVRPGQAWIYCENEIHILSGDPDEGFADLHPSGIAQGTPSRTGVSRAGGGDVAYLGLGIYYVNGSSAEKISHAIDPIFHGRNITLWDGTVAQSVSDKSTVCVGYDDGVVWVGYDNTRTLKHDRLTNRWFQDSRAFTCFQGESEVGILGALTSGTIVKMEQGSQNDTTDGGSAIPIDFLSKAYDFGIQDNEKRVEDVTIYHDTRGQDLTVNVYYAEGVSAGAFTINSYGDARTVLQLNNADGVRARNFAVRISGNTVSEVLIRAIDFNFYPEARQAKSFDSAVTNGGTNNVKRIRELRFDIENDTNVGWKLETDVPSFALASRATGTIQTNLFRRLEPVVLSSEIYGHDFRVVLDGSDGSFHPFGAEALVQVIGTYIHGQKSEYYLSDVVDFGSERVKLAREIELIYAGYAGTITIYSDLPGNAVIVRGMAEFPQVSGEQSIKIPLPGTLKGRLFQVRLEATADCRFEALRMRIKQIGEPGATSWYWASFPMATTQDAVWVSLSLPPDVVG